MDADAFELVFQRTGGLFAGAELETSVSSGELDERTRTEVGQYIERAGVERLAEASPMMGPGADMYQYELSVARQGGLWRITVSQTAVPENLWPLLEWLEQRAIDEHRS